MNKRKISYLRYVMKSFHLNIACMFFILFAFIACKKQTPPPQFHYDYFDLTPGRYIDYEVMDIVHADGQAIEHDTTRYFLRTLVGDTVHDNEGRVARKFLRYKRNSLSESWVLSDIWTTIIAGNKAELIEENQRTIKLVFAPTLAKEWNPNAYNTLPEMEAYYRDIHEAQMVGNINFDSTLVVEMADEPTFISYKRKFEVYAKGVGLVHKFYKDISIVNFDTLNVTDGTESHYKCIGYGKQ